MEGSQQQQQQQQQPPLQQQQQQQQQHQQRQFSHQHHQPPPPSHNDGSGRSEPIGHGTGGSNDDADGSGEKHQRIALACFQCRTKKAKCSGTTPVCVQCARQNLMCEWPSGRKRKRTRKEMLEAAAEAAANGGSVRGRGDRSLDRLEGRGGLTAIGGGQLQHQVQQQRQQQQQQHQAGPSGGPQYQHQHQNQVQRPAGTLARNDLVGQQMLGGSFDNNPPMLWHVDFPQDPSTSNPLFNVLPSSVSPQQQQPGQTQHHTPSVGLADWMSNSFLPDTNAAASSSSSSAGTPAGGSTLGQQTSQALPTPTPTQRAPSAGRQSFSSGTSIPPAQPYSSTFPSLSMPFKAPADALPIMESAPSTSLSGRLQASNGSGEGTVSSSHKAAGYEGAFGPGQPLNPDNGQDQRGILNAVTSQVGFLEGESGEPYLKLYYYRVSGNTAIHPGINRICLKLQLRPPPPTSPSNSHTTSGTVPSAPTPRADLQDVQFDPQTDMASPSVYLPLIELFFRVAGQHFPSIQPVRIQKRFESGQMSAFLCNAMCAIAARHSPLGRTNPANAGNAFLAKAHELVVPLLRMPTTDGVTGLLLLAWAEHGQNSESGFWQFSGLAIRMAVDLGFFRNTDEMYEDYAHFVRTKNLLWSLFMTDRLLALSTGRPCTIQECDIEIPLPLEEEIPEGPRPPGTENDPPLPSPFVWCIKLMVLCGRIANLLNGSRGHARTFVSPDSASTIELKALQTELVGFYSKIPPRMVWSVDNFKDQAQQERGGVFLMFHCWANAVIGMLHHPAILFSPGGSDTPMTKAMNRSIKLALASSRTICECAVFADLCSPTSYTASPGLSQTLYIAGLAFIAEMKHASLGIASGMNSATPPRPPSPIGDALPAPLSSSSHPPQASDAFLNLLAQQNLNVIVKALQQMTHYWAGAGVMLNILKQRSQGMTHSKIDFSATSDNIKTFVSLPDSGVLRRFTSDLAPPGLSPADQLATIASLSPACSPESNLPDLGQLPDEWNLDALLSSYSIEGMSVEPAGGFYNFDALEDDPAFRE